MSLVAFNDIHNRIIQWFFCSQIEEIHIKWAFICLTMGSQWLIHWWWALASILDCCYDRGRKNRFEAALRPLCAFWRGAWYSDRNLLSILNSEFTLHTVCTYLLKESHVMYHETVIIFRKFAFMHSVEKVFRLLLSFLIQSKLSTQCVFIVFK